MPEADKDQQISDLLFGATAQSMPQMPNWKQRAETAESELARLTAQLEAAEKRVAEVTRGWNNMAATIEGGAAEVARLTAQVETLTKDRDQLDWSARKFQARIGELMQQVETFQGEYRVPKEPVAEVHRRYMLQGLEADYRTVSLTCLTCGGRYPHHIDCDPSVGYFKFKELLKAAERHKARADAAEAQVTALLALLDRTEHDIKTWREQDGAERYVQHQWDGKLALIRQIRAALGEKEGL